MITVQYQLGGEVYTATAEPNAEGEYPFNSIGAHEFLVCVGGMSVAVASIVTVSGLPGDTEGAMAREVADWVNEGQTTSEPY